MDNKGIIVRLLVEELTRKLGRQPTQTELEARAWELVKHNNERMAKWKRKTHSKLH